MQFHSDWWVIIPGAGWISAGSQKDLNHSSSSCFERGRCGLPIQSFFIFFWILALPQTTCSKFFEWGVGAVWPSVRTSSDSSSKTPHLRGIEKPQCTSGIPPTPSSPLKVVNCACAQPREASARERKQSFLVSAGWCVQSIHSWLGPLFTCAPPYTLAGGQVQG